MAAQSLLVVFGPTIVAIGDDLGASVSAIGQARSITAIVAAGASVAVIARGDAVGVSWLMGIGGALGVLFVLPRRLLMMGVGASPEPSRCSAPPDERP